MRFGVSLSLALSFMGIGGKRTVSNARKSLYGTIAGIGISLVPMIAVLVVSDGMIEGITSRLIELSSSHLRIVDYSGQNGFDLGPTQAEALAASLNDGSLAVSAGGNSIVEACAERQGIGLVIGKAGRAGGTIRAVQPAFFGEGGVVMGLVSVLEGSARLDGPGDAVLGKKIAADLGIVVGDTFRVLTMRTGARGRAVPRFTQFTLRGIVSSGYQELDALWVFIPFRTGCEILAPESSQTFVSARTDDPFLAIEALRNAAMRALPEGINVYTWKEMNRSQFHSFTTTRTLLLFIMFLIVLVASVNISSALVMLVMERRKEIAILKSVGAEPACVTYAFLLAGFFTGLGGILAGMPAGVLCALNINWLLGLLERFLNASARLAWALRGPLGISSDGETFGGIRLLDPEFYLEVIPIRVRLGELFAVASGVLILSILVSVLPAIRAGREKPLDTLRKY